MTSSRSQDQRMPRKRPGDELSQEATPPPQPGSSRAGRTERTQHSKTSTRLNNVTAHACLTCRKQRSKCDGQNPCARCKIRGTNCVYEVKVRQTKAQLRAEVAALRRRQQMLDQMLPDVITSERPEQLVADKRHNAPEDGVTQATPTRRLSNSFTSVAESVSIFSQKPRPSRRGTRAKPRPSGDHLKSVTDEQHHKRSTAEKEGAQVPTLNPSSQVSQRAQAPDDDIKSRLRATTRLRRQTSSSQQVLEVQRVYEAGQPLSELQLDTAMPWTCITSDTGFIRHLLALYFCWEYPNFAPISKEHFLQDFYDQGQQYCSPMLVNALLALSCRLSDRLSPAGDDISTASDSFFDESRRLLFSSPDHYQITTVQSLAIMSMREARYSRFLESKYYAEHAMQLAIEMGLHDGPSDKYAIEADVLAKTFWGVFTLNHAWSFVNGKLAHCPDALHRPPMLMIAADVETSSWSPYVDGDVHLEPHVQLSNVRSLYQHFCQLNEKVHKSLNPLYSPVQSLTATNLLQNYHKYLDWYDQLPEVLRLGHNSTPAVLFAHLYYHFSILLLFRPFLAVRLIRSQIIPVEICLQAADAIQRLVSSYSKLYTLRRTPTFMPFFTFASATVYIAASTLVPELNHDKSSILLRPNGSDAVRLSIAHLEEMAPYNDFAKQAPYILSCLSCKWGSKSDVKASQGLSHKTEPNRVSGNQPASAGLEVTSGSERTGPIERSVEVVFSALLQDKSVLPSGPDLHRAGFSLL